jgi:hypothetical protein
MANNYLENKITKYKLYSNFVLGLLIAIAFIAGHLFSFESLLGSIIVGAIFGAVGMIVIHIIEYYTKKQASYRKGLDLETQLENKFKKLGINYEQNINTKYGDLDFLVNKDNKYFGIEAKNWAGEIIFENGLLKVAGYNQTKVLRNLLKHCQLVKDKEFGEESNNFIKPILVFGYKAVINIPQNRIRFNNVDVIVTTIKDFEKYIK